MFPKRNKYPRHIFFGAEKYRLKFIKNLGCYGETDSGEKEIRIKAGMSEHQTLRTLLHELIHLVEFEAPIKIKHKLVYKLEEALFELLLANFL